MAMFNEIKISGFDPDRPPRVRKESYIDLFYQLSEEAPEEWCDDFETFGRHLNPRAKVDRATRGFINSYVNDMSVIPKNLEQLKLAVFECNTQYIEKLKQRAQDMARESQNLKDQGGLQFKLNEIIESLDFSTKPG